jgi:gamma-glutamylcysteine synthetase
VRRLESGKPIRLATVNKLFNLITSSLPEVELNRDVEIKSIELKPKRRRKALGIPHVDGKKA